MAWRRVVVPAGYSLRELHGVIQVAMGWEGIHLYQFRRRVVSRGFRLAVSPKHSRTYLSNAHRMLRQALRFYPNRSVCPYAETPRGFV